MAPRNDRIGRDSRYGKPTASVSVRTLRSLFSSSARTRAAASALASLSSRRQPPEDRAIAASRRRAVAVRDEVVRQLSGRKTRLIRVGADTDTAEQIVRTPPTVPGETSAASKAQTCGRRSQRRAAGGGWSATDVQRRLRAKRRWRAGRGRGLEFCTENDFEGVLRAHRKTQSSGQEGNVPNQKRRIAVNRNEKRDQLEEGRLVRN
jgi:hypothetical protein